MGGIGKTVSAAWLARDEDVRGQFSLVLWVTLGQQPDLSRLQRLIYLQATGKELKADVTPEQAKEIILRSLRGRTVLLILDDCWEEAHQQELNLVDTSTSSKTLITTRIRSLGGASHVELGLPSEEQAIKLLLASAELSTSTPPAEAVEVVAICGRLPLAIDVAGKLLRDLCVNEGDWAGVPPLLKQELRCSADEKNSIEYRVISVSLQTIPLRDREGAQAVFRAFALVPEDTVVPIKVFALLLSVITGQNELVPELQLRKWLQVLVNRSIVLGTWERPQLHDVRRLLMRLARRVLRS